METNDGVWSQTRLRQRLRHPGLVVASALAIVALSLVWARPAAAAPQTCEINAKATMLSGRFTQAEVEITVRYDAPDCASDAGASNVTVYKERCYSNFFINATTTERCKRFNYSTSPNGVWMEKTGLFSWSSAGSGSGTFWLSATVAPSEADTLYYTCEWGAFKPNDAKMHCSGHIKHL